MRNGSPVAKLIALSLMLLLVTGLWTPVLAARGQSFADIEAFRAKLAMFMQDLDLPDAQKADAIAKVQSMPVADLTILYNAYPKDGAFWNAARKTKAFLQSDASKQMHAMGATAARPPAAASLVAVAGAAASATTQPTCPSPAFDYGNKMYEALWIARDAELVADIAMEVIPEDFTTSPAYIVAAIAWGALKATLFVIEQQYERWDDCESTKLFNNIDAPISSLVTSIENATSSLSNINVIRDKVESLVAFAALGGPGGPATLFKGTNFSGDSMSVGVDDGCLGGFWGNVGSVKVPPGATLILYDKCNFTGAFRTYTANDSNVADDGWTPGQGPGSVRIVQPPPAEPIATKASVDTLGGKIDHLVTASGGGQLVRDLAATVNASVPRRTGASGPITLYVQPNLTGTSRVFQGDEADLRCLGGPFFTDSKSVRVPPGTTVTFYAACEFGGDSKTFTVDDTDLSDNRLVNPNDGTLMFPAASMRVTQTQVPVADAIASQTSVDLLAATVAALDTSDNGALAEKIDSLLASIGTGGLAHLDATISSRASQATVSGLTTSVTAMQSGLTTMQVSLGNQVTSLASAVAGTSSQASVDALASIIGAVGTKVGGLDFSKLDAAVTTRASQSSVDAIGPKIDAIGPQITALGTNTAAGLMAVQSKVNALDTGKLDAAMSSRASQSSLDAGIASLLAAMNSQAALSVEIIEIQKRKRYLVHVTLAGAPVSGGALSRIRLLELTDHKPAVATDGTADATVVEVAPGILDITLNVPGGKTDAVAVTVTRGAMTGSAILPSK
jgi:hypothetical protein